MMVITKAKVQAYAARYDQKTSQKDKRIEAQIKGILITQRFLTKNQFLKICGWKSPRKKHNYKENDANAVKELTAFSFSASKASDR